MRKILISLLLFTFVCARAQNLSVHPINRFDTFFNKDRSSWDWRGVFTYATDTDNGFGAHLTDLFESQYEPRRALSKWRDQNKLDAYFFYKSPGLYNGFYIDSWYLNDLQTESKSRVAINSVGYKLNYESSKYVSLAPYAGYQKRENKSIIDYGWDTGLDAKLIKYPVGTYITDARLKMEYDLYPEQKFAENLVNIFVKKQFSSLTSDSLAVYYGVTHEKYFASNGVDLIQVDKEHKGLNNFLFYNFAAQSRLELITVLESKNIFDDSPIILKTDDIPNRRDVLRFENQLNYRYAGANYYMLFGLHTSQETHDNEDITTDSKAQETSLISTFVYSPGPADDINLQMSYVKYQYETPDTLINFDDRDAIRFTGQINYSHRFSPLLLIDLEFSAYLFHNMYIFQEQSANNNWFRIYRLGAAVRYQYRKFRNQLYTYVLANYTVYDYDELFDETRSFVSREYVLSDSLLVPLISDFNLGFFGRLEIEDRGTFFEKDFTQLVVESNEIRYYDIFLQKQHLLKFTIDLGMAVYHRRGWRHLPEKRLDRDLTKVSPYFRIIYPLSPHIRFRAYISMTELNDRGREKENYATGSLMMMYYF
jgi:hypothetical protein